MTEAFFKICFFCILIIMSVCNLGRVDQKKTVLFFFLLSNWNNIFFLFVACLVGDKQATNSATLFVTLAQTQPSATQPRCSECSLLLFSRNNDDLATTRI